MRATSLVLWLLVAAALGVFCRDASACDNWTQKGRIIGVSETGTFVYVRHTSGYTSCDAFTFDVYSAEVRLVARYRLDGEDGCDGAWGSSGTPPVPAIQGEAPEALESRLRAQLGLQPLEPAPDRVRVSRRPHRSICAQFNLLAPWGSAPVWDLGEGFGGVCPAVRVAARRHRASALLFLTYDYKRGGSCPVSVSDVYWVPPTRIDAAAFAVKGKRLLARGQPEGAVALLRRALEADPVNIATRILFARALAGAKTPWDRAVTELSIGFPSAEGRCLGGHFSDWVQALEAKAFAGWRAQGGFEAFLDALGRRHSEAHSDNPQLDAKWVAEGAGR